MSTSPDPATLAVLVRQDLAMSQGKRPLKWPTLPSGAASKRETGRCPV